MEYNKKPGTAKLWDTIHIIGKTYNTKLDNTSDSFVCFFECLCDLLPQRSYRDSLREYIRQNPTSNATSSAESTFEWTYNLHSYINFVKRRRGQMASTITQEEARVMYSRVTKDFWGSVFWYTIHYLAANMPKVPSPQERCAFVAFIMSVRYLIPCADCRNHMQKYIESVDIHRYCDRGEDMFRYTWEFHNAVSQRIGSPTIDFNTALSLYRVKDNNTFIDSD